MPFTGIADQRDIDLMTEALNAYCQERGIVDEDNRSFIAQRIVSLFFSGSVTVEKILEGLRSGDDKEARKDRPDRAARRGLSLPERHDPAVCARD